MFNRTPFLAVAGLALAACAAQPIEPAPGPVPDETVDACGASSLQYLVGQPDDVLAAMTFPDTTRFIGPDMAVTMDHVPSRLNIEYDERNYITRVYCG